MNPSPFEECSPIVSRRGFLAAGGAGVVGMSLRTAVADRPGRASAVVRVVLTGGASQLETFDPKPHAPREIRGPLHSIATRIPGVRFSECLPRLAERADRLVVMRSLTHDAAPIHQTGLQYLLYGRLVSRRSTPLTIDAHLEELLGDRRRGPFAATVGGSFRRVLSMRPLELSGGGAGESDAEAAESVVPIGRPFCDASAAERERYGDSRFGEQLWSALQLIHQGVRSITVNTFHRLEGHATWDAHGCPTSGPANVFDYRDTIGPAFDRAMAAFLDDLQATGLWERTLVVCAGDMGRTANLNENLGRDHWTAAASGFLAGGMVQGGQVVGETDERAETVTDSPIPLSQLSEIVLDHMGISSSSELAADPSRSLRIADSAIQTG